MNVVHVFPENTLLYPGRRRRWYVRLVSANGEPLATSEAYFSKFNATRAAKKNFPGLAIKYVDV